jgi:hypothetical protein
MLDEIWIAPVPEARSQPAGQTELPLNTAQQQNPRVRRKPTAIEPHAHLLAANRWKIEGKCNIFAHDGCGAPQSISEPASQPGS